MFETLKSEKNLGKELLHLSNKKDRLISLELENVVKKQLKIVNILKKKSETDYKKLIKNSIRAISGYEGELLSKLSLLNSSQESMLIDSLMEDFKEVTKIWDALGEVYIMQLKSISAPLSKSDTLQRER